MPLKQFKIFAFPEKVNTINVITKQRNPFKREAKFKRKKISFFICDHFKNMVALTLPVFGQLY
jgi:hypothetical protein